MWSSKAHRDEDRVGATGSQGSLLARHKGPRGRRAAFRDHLGAARFDLESLDEVLAVDVVGLQREQEPFEKVDRP